MNEVERGAIRRFAESLGDYNPIYFDEEYARASGFPTIVAPPTFPCSFQTGTDVRELLGVPLRLLVVAEMSFDYERPVYAGDRVLVTAKVSDIAERPGPTGKVEIAVIEEEGRDEEGRVVYRSRRTLLVRTTKEGT